MDGSAKSQVLTSKLSYMLQERKILLCINSFYYYMGKNPKNNTEKLTGFLPEQRNQILVPTIGYETSCNMHRFIPDLRSNSTKVSRSSL